MFRYASIFLVFSLLFALGCSGSGNPVNPDTPPVQKNELRALDGHSIWGLWQFSCDPVTGDVEIIPLRDADIHLNALKFLEPPAGLYLSLESSPMFTGNVMDIDIGLRHPFLGLPQFTGFDVCGILISNGSVTGYSDVQLIGKGEGDTRIINPDGLTRWWNPAEFPANGTMFGYQDGLLGIPDGQANYTATVNGYKYFADGLEANDQAWTTDVPKRGSFAAGQKNVRHYTIELDGGFTFNYAIDANWKATGLPPSQIEIPDSFTEAANRPEAWAISVIETDNTLYYQPTTMGGTLGLDIIVHDWFNADQNILLGESLAGIESTLGTGPIDGGANFSTYHLDLNGTNLETSGEIEILISVESEIIGYGGLLPDEPVTAYFTYTTTVSDEPPQQGAKVFYVCGDKTVVEYGAQYADNEAWIKNMYRKASGECADNQIVKFYHGHGGFEMPCALKDLIFGWIINDGYTPVQSSEEPIDTTDCRHIHITMPGRNSPNFYSDAEIETLKQFIDDGGILIIFAEVGYAHPDKTTFDHLIQSLGSGCAWGGDYTSEGSTFNTDKFDDGHPMFEGCGEIYWNLPAYVIPSKPTDNVIAWGMDGEAMFVESQLEW